MRTTRRSARTEPSAATTSRKSSWSVAARGPERLNPSMPAEAVEQAVTEITKPRTAMHYARANRRSTRCCGTASRCRSASRTARRSRGSASSTGRTRRRTTSCWCPSSGSTATFTTARRPARFRQWHPAGLHRAEGLTPQPEARLRRQPPRLPRHDPAPVHPQWLYRPLQRRGKQGRHYHVGLGVLHRVEEDQLRGRARLGVAGDGHPGHVHQGPAARPHRELRCLPGPARRVRQAARPESPVPRRQQRHRPAAGAADAPQDERGKLGVFWHTQGSGKTMSMLFFSQKILRKLPGNWTFVIVTDREDLDEQAHKEFVWAGVVSEEHMRATSRRTSGSCSLRITAMSSR